MQLNENKNELDNLKYVIKNEKIAVSTITSYSLSLTNELGVAIDSITKLNALARDTVRPAKQVDTLIMFDTIVVETTITTYADSITNSYIKNSSLKFGTISFVDTSNHFVDVNVVVDFPHGQRTIYYRDKYVRKYFNKFVGIGRNDNRWFVQTIFMYGDIGVGFSLNTKGKIGYACILHL
jgi:hypothetical protein